MPFPQTCARPSRQAQPLTAWRRRPCGSSQPSCGASGQAWGPAGDAEPLPGVHGQRARVAQMHRWRARLPGVHGQAAPRRRGGGAQVHRRRAAHLLRSSTRCSSSAAAMVIIMAASASACDGRLMAAVAAAALAGWLAALLLLLAAHALRAFPGSPLAEQQAARPGCTDCCQQKKDHSQPMKAFERNCGTASLWRPTGPDQGARGREQLMLQLIGRERLHRR